MVGRKQLVSLAAGVALATAGGDVLCAPKELGFNVHQSDAVGLNATKDAGLSWVRIDLNWLQAEPTQGTYDWTVIDSVVDKAVAKNLKVLAVVAYGPAWASSGDKKGDGPNNDVPNAGTYAAFVTAVVNRYQAKVTHYEMWNEPNLGQFWEGTTQDYLDRVLVPGADAVHAACATCKVVGPGLATVGTEYASWMEGVLTNAADKLDIVSGHIYAQFPDGSGSGAGFTSDSFFNKLDDHRVIKLGSVTVYEGPLSFHEELVKHGVTKDFWLTETGIEAPLGDAAKEETQRLYYRHVMEQMLVRPWWTNTIFYESFDEPPPIGQYHFGAVVHDDTKPAGYSPKAVFGLLQKVTSSAPAFGGSKTECDDGLDDDLDGYVDYPDDTMCLSPTSPSEGTAPPPGDGGASSSSSSSGGSSTSSSSSSGGDVADGGASSSSGGDAAGGGGDSGGCSTSSSSADGGLALALFGIVAVSARRRAVKRRLR